MPIACYCKIQINLHNKTSLQSLYLIKQKSHSKTSIQPLQSNQQHFHSLYNKSHTLTSQIPPPKMFNSNPKQSSSLNINEDYINFIKNNHNMIEKHLMSQFQHPYKMSLLKSHGIESQAYKQKNEEFKVNDGGVFGTRNFKRQKKLGQGQEFKMKLMQTIESNDHKRSAIFISKDPSNKPQQDSQNSRKQQLCNSLNFINPPINHSMQLGQSSHSTKRSKNQIFPKDQILQIIQQKNKQISQQLLRQRNNFSQIVYKNNHHSQGKVIVQQQKQKQKQKQKEKQRQPEGYVLQRYEHNRMNGKSLAKGNQISGNQRYNNERCSVDQQLSQSQLITETLEDSSNSNLLLPAIKKRSQSFRHQTMTKSDSHIVQKLPLTSSDYEIIKQVNQRKLSKDNNPFQNNQKQSQNYNGLSQSINQLRKQFLQNSDDIKLFKKVEKNNIALKVKQINQKNLKSYYDYENAIIRKSQQYLIDEENNRNAILRQTKMQQRQKKLKQVLNGKTLHFYQQDKQQKKQTNRLSQEERFVREIAGNKSQQEVKKSLAMTISPVAKQRQQKLSNDRQGELINTQQNQQSQKTITTEKQMTSSSPTKRFKLKSLQSILPAKTQGTIYDSNMRSYRQFAFKLYFAHKRFNQLTIRELSTTNMKNEQKFKFYVGKGNNSLLIKSLMKRRFWWVLEDDPKKANFIWTQLKINSLFQLQRKSEQKSLYYKAQNSQLINNSSIKKISKSQRKKDQNNQEKQKKSNIFKAPLPEDNEMKVFTQYDKRAFTRFTNAIKQMINSQKLDIFQKRLAYFPQKYFDNIEQPQKQPNIDNQPTNNQQPPSLYLSSSLKSTRTRIHNHFQFNHFIGNKKALFYNLRYYYQLIKKDVCQIIPLTFHIRNGQKDPEYAKFLKYYKMVDKKASRNSINVKEQSPKKKQKNIWIVKPGENSNRGNGIQVFDQLYELNTILKKKASKNQQQPHTYIVQKYIQKPLLYKNRKFDIRHYFILTRMWGKMRAYFFGEGYIRTASYQFDLRNVGDTQIHLTNDAIQKNCEEYGKYEEGNKLSYAEFQRYLNQLAKEENAKQNGKKKQGEKKPVSFANQIYPQMRNIAQHAIKACYIQMDPNKTQHNFQVFGMDFMIDRDYKVWLIEINTNPCLQLSSKLLQRVIPSMVQQSMRLTIDIIFPPPYHYPNTMKHMMPDYSLDKFKFELIFDEDRDGKELEELFNKQAEREKKEGKKTIREVLLGEIDEEDETYENDGKEISVGEKGGVHVE